MWRCNFSHRTLVDAKLDNYFETAKEFRSFFIFIVYGVSEDGENSLLVLLCSVEDVEKKTVKTLLVISIFSRFSFAVNGVCL